MFVKVNAYLRVNQLDWQVGESDNQLLECMNDIKLWLLFLQLCTSIWESDPGPYKV